MLFEIENNIQILGVYIIKSQKMKLTAKQIKLRNCVVTFHVESFNLQEVNK